MQIFEQKTKVYLWSLEKEDKTICKKPPGLIKTSK
jgi:hypothetical protein